MHTPGTHHAPLLTPSEKSSEWSLFRELSRSSHAALRICKHTFASCLVLAIYILYTCAIHHWLRAVAFIPELTRSRQSDFIHRQTIIEPPYHRQQDAPCPICFRATRPQNWPQHACLRICLRSAQASLACPADFSQGKCYFQNVASTSCYIHCQPLDAVCRNQLELVPTLVADHRTVQSKTCLNANTLVNSSSPNRKSATTAYVHHSPSPCQRHNRRARTCMDISTTVRGVELGGTPALVTSEVSP
jgi:hypothetical protein